MWKIATSYARGTVKDSPRKFVTFWLVLGIWRSDTGMSWSRSMLLVGHRPIATSLLILSATTNIWGGAQSNVVNLHLFPKWGWKLFEIYLEISLSCYLRKKEMLFFARPSVCTYLSLAVRSRRRDCSRKVKDGRFVSLIFFNLGEQQVNVLLQNSKQLACDD